MSQPSAPNPGKHYYYYYYYYYYYCESPKKSMLMESIVSAVGEPVAPLKDPAPQAEEQTRNQNVEDATNDPQTPKVKSEKECMYRDTQCWGCGGGSMV